MPAIEERKPAEKRRALGRGLDSLLPSGPRVVQAAVPPPVIIPAAPGQITELHRPLDGSQQQRDMASPHAAGEAPAPHPSSRHGQEIIELPLELIDENPYQTRRTFDEAALAELAESIKASGLAQPVVVRPGANGRYVLVLGERRCRASKVAGKAAVPAIVRQLGNEQAAEMTIVENLQRQDLNCLEQAEAFARLSREFNLTQEQIGHRTGVSRESVANYMRLLKLPPKALEHLGQGKLGFSEARVLLEALPHVEPSEVEDLAHAAVQLGLTVRDLKGRVEKLLNPELHQAEPRPEKPVDPNVRDAERRLREALGLRVVVRSRSAEKGQIVIRYDSVEDFDRVLDMLGKE